MLASLYKVRHQVMGVSFTDFCSVVEKMGVNVEKVKEHMVRIPLQRLVGRLFHMKTPLDSNVQAYETASS